MYFFSEEDFFHRHWEFIGQQEKGGIILLFHFNTSTCSQIARHLFATLHVSSIFNCNTWYLPECYSIRLTALLNYDLIDWLMIRCLFVRLFTWWFDSRFLLQQFDTGNQLIRTHIDYHPYITSEPTKCAGHSKVIGWITFK